MCFMNSSARYFMRREDYAPETTPAESPFRKFRVSCLGCRSHQLLVLLEHDEPTGEAALVLRCGKCGQKEKVEF